MRRAARERCEAEDCWKERPIRPSAAEQRPEDAKEKSRTLNNTETVCTENKKQKVVFVTV
jgi:hypothetical protein